MSNTFKIVITATDKATSSVKRINDSISKMMRPLNNVARSAKALGKELSRNPAVKALKTIALAAKNVAMSIGGVAVSMAGLVGIGTLAGMGVLVTAWGRLGFEVSKTSSLLGVSTDSLQTMRGAAELAGNSSEELTAGLGSLRQNLQDARWGRNQGVVALMSRLRMSFRHTADGSVDVVESMKDVADAIAKQKDIGAKHTIAQAFGIEELLPLLMKGRKGIEEYQKRAASLAGYKGPQAIEQARQLGERFKEMGLAVDGLKMSIGGALLPVLDPLVRKFTQLIAVNRDAIGAKIGEWANRIAEWIQTVDWDKFADRIATIGTAIGFIVDKMADLIAMYQKLGNKTPAYYALHGGIPGMVYDYFKGGDDNRSGGGKIGTAPLGIRNNNPLNMQPGGSEASFDSPEEGISAGIRNILKNYQGLTLAQYVHKYAPASGKGNSAASEAGYLNDLSSGTGIAPNQVPNLMDPKVLAPLISAQIKHENGQNPYDKSTIDNAVSHVVVEFKNAPPGTTATARSKGGTAVPVRVNHTLPTLAAG